MATIIDALVVTLGLDTSEFRRGQKEAEDALDETKATAEETGKRMEASGKQAASFFSGLRNQIIALAGVTLSLKGIEDFMSSFSSKLNDLSIASTAFGMKAKNLDGWIQAGKAFGVSAEEIASSFSKISDAQEKLQAGRGKDQIITDIMRFSNMTGAGIDVMNDSAETVNRKIEANFSKLSAEQQRAFGMELGRGYAWQKWSATGHSVSDIDEFTKNSGVNDAAIQSAERMRKAWVKVTQTIENIGYIIYTELEPHLEDFYQWLNDLASWMKDHPKEIKDAIGEVISGLKDLIPTVNDAASAIGKLNSVIKEIVNFLNVLPGSDAVREAGEKIGANEIGIFINDKTTKFKRWAYGKLGISDDEPLQRAQSAKAPKATGKGKQLLDWMGGQFSQLEQKYNLPDGILRSIATTESGGDQFAVGPMTKYGQAKGLFQFMDPTAKDMGLKGNDVFDPEKSASAAAKYLSQLLQQTGGNLQEAIAAYNWGIGNVQNKGLGMAPAETRNYVPKVLAGMQVGAAANAQSHINSNVTNSTTSDSNVYNISKLQVGADVKNVSDIMTDAKQKIGRSSLVTAYATGVSG
ncbi:lytic transglycosylase domain-containing protein [Serratia fonticola]|uniref:lytic transglycosylase domain-containing protein n=1 Tax=Serratia fonticola TaxID=47917 RepID=UPI0015C5F559|nr:lytic transglycosylase domain-containing protein [Serratia fonticola]NYA42975.1 lytic transglycosylase domain-containing protein [Serratia fonticola]